MTHIAKGPKMEVSIELSEDLIAKARLLTRNLSETVELLLADYIEAERCKRAEREQRIDHTIDLLKEHEAKYGIWGEEFSTL